MIQQQNWRKPDFNYQISNYNCLMYRAILSAFLMLYVISCAEKPEEGKSEDLILFEELNDNSFHFYQLKDTVLEPTGGSPHGPFRLRFNNPAFQALDTSGKLPEGSKFPDGSIVLKELISNGKVSGYVALKKSNSHKSAEKGWLWYGFNKDGSIKYDKADKGNSCTGCHSASSRDFVLSFDIHH